MDVNDKNFSLEDRTFHFIRCIVESLVQINDIGITVEIENLRLDDPTSLSQGIVEINQNAMICSGRDSKTEVGRVRPTVKG